MSAARKKQRPPSCEECFFRCHGLCALDLDQPCSTFRPNLPEGLVPPRQPALLVRDPEAAAANLDDGLTASA